MAKRDRARLSYADDAMARQNQGLRLVRELGRYAMNNKKWWLAPIVIVSVLLIALVVAGNTPLAPFIYTVF